MPLPAAPKKLADTVKSKDYGAKIIPTTDSPLVTTSLASAPLPSEKKSVKKTPANKTGRTTAKRIPPAPIDAVVSVSASAVAKASAPLPIVQGASRLRKPRATATTTKPRIFVLDTNVLLHDPMCLFRFEEHDVFLPMTTLEELDNHKTGMSDIARNARQVSRTIDELIESATGSITEGVALNGLGSKEAHGRLYFQTTSLTATLPQGLPQGKADNMILATVRALQEHLPDKSVVLVSKDINMRIKATTLGIAAEDYFNDKTIDDTDLLYSGRTTLPENFWEQNGKTLESWTADDRTWYRVTGKIARTLHVNEFVTTEDASFAAQVKTVDANEAVLVTLKDYMQPRHAVWGIHARNIEQSMALNLLMNPEIDFVTLLGQAGTGKTLMTLAAALTQTLDERRFSEIIFTRATVSVGEEIGFLPGTEEEKMAPWMGALEDNLEVLNKSDRSTGDWGRNAAADLIRSRIRVKSMSFMRGRTFLNKFVIIDEAQNLSPKQMKTLITRAGPGSKIVCLGNIAQIDTPYLTEGSSGLTYVVDRFKGWPHAGHITLQRGERSRLADFASEAL